MALFYFKLFGIWFRSHTTCELSSELLSTWLSHYFIIFFWKVCAIAYALSLSQCRHILIFNCYVHTHCTVLVMMRANFRWFFFCFWKIYKIWGGLQWTSFHWYLGLKLMYCDLKIFEKWSYLNYTRSIFIKWHIWK